MIPFQDLKKANECQLQQHFKAAERVLLSGRYINGPEVKAFEDNIAKNCGSKFCVAVSTGLDALRLIFLGYKELGILREGDEVIIPSNTFIATFLAPTSCGMTAVAADVDEHTYCLDFEKIPLTQKTKAIVTVHLYGNPCWDAEKLSELKNRGILIIEDNAQAIGARSSEKGFNNNNFTGNLGDAAAISFYPAKNIGAFGDAGAVLTNDSSLALKVRQLANYGASDKYYHDICGFNCRMDEMQAAFLNIKLECLQDVITRRNAVAKLYNNYITHPDIILPRFLGIDTVQVWHQYVIRTPHRDSLRKYLKEHGVETEIHYPIPCHLQNCYKNNPLIKTTGNLPVAERLAREVLSLPIATVTDDEILTIAQLINDFKN